jgi:hypothetical protein
MVIGCILFNMEAKIPYPEDPLKHISYSFVFTFHYYTQLDDTIITMH